MVYTSKLRICINQTIQDSEITYGSLNVNHKQLFLYISDDVTFKSIIPSYIFGEH